MRRLTLSADTYIRSRSGVFRFQPHRHAAQDGVAGERIAQVLVEQRVEVGARPPGGGLQVDPGEVVAPAMR